MQERHDARDSVEALLLQTGPVLLALAARVDDEATEADPFAQLFFRVPVWQHLVRLDEQVDELTVAGLAHSCNTRCVSVGGLPTTNSRWMPHLTGTTIALAQSLLSYRLFNRTAELAYFEGVGR